MIQIEPDNVLNGPFWPEKVRVISVRHIGTNQTKIEAVGLRSMRYYNSILSFQDIESIEIIESKMFRFTGDGTLSYLYLESHRIRNAFQFDPLFAVNVSQIDPLPHQIEAVYNYILQNPRIRFMLADDPGAGKTIMAGLLLKELKYRGLVQRTLIVAPGHLKDQWHREMKDKFQEKFKVVDRNLMRSSWGQNVFTDENQAIISLDFAKQDDVMLALKDSRWDLTIVDEAHKMSAYKYGEKVTKTGRYNLGELLSPLTDYLLFLTATPHRGDPENFRLLLDLLEPGLFADTSMLAESIENRDNPLFLRRLKENLKDFDDVPIFPPRTVETIGYQLSDEEARLYNAVTEYVQKHFNKALEKEKRNVAFALTILQRRLASSVRAIRKSLERREERLKILLEKSQIFQDIQFDEGYLDDLEEKERWKKEEELLAKLTSADSFDELEVEIEKLQDLVAIAKEVEKKEIETKLTELKRVMDSEHLSSTDVKLLIFTESKDTLEYLVEKLKKWGYPVVFIHGGMDLDQRIRAENEFKNTAQIMVSTEAGGEGINLQFCWLMVNYDIPWNPNRLEQRMGRIHRYKQRHHVHIYNLVATDTREGRILARLFEKLQHIRDQLGSDRVFDVIGEVLTGKSLKDLIVDAIADRGMWEEALRDFERTPDEAIIRKVREASLEALATPHIDLSRVLGEQRQAIENKLVPEYVEQFFITAAAPLNIKIEERQKGIWRITSVPFDVRDQPHEFKIRFGEVFKEYNKITFDKGNVAQHEAEFVAMGHPLLESAVSSILTQYESIAAEGSTFEDPERKKDGIVWFFECEIRDGNAKTAGKRLLALYQDLLNTADPFSFVNSSILYDLKPLSERESSTEVSQLPSGSIDMDAINMFVINHGIEVYRKELLERRQRDADIKQKYGIRSLDSMILESDAKLSDYETRRLKKEHVPPEVTIHNELRKKEDLERKKKNLLKEIEAETHLYPVEPKIISAVRVVPGPAIGGEMFPDSEIEQLGMQVVAEYERSKGREPEDVHLKNLGYDIRSCDKEERFRYIEVKARARSGDIALTPNEWTMASRLRDKYWLYVVINARSNAALYLIPDPASKLQPEKVVSIVRYVVKDWQAQSEAA